MEVSENGLNLIYEEEGFRSCPYRDVTGTWTRGIGETEGITPNSRCISLQEAKNNVRRIFHDRYSYAINDLGKKINQNQYDALADFIWNCGPGSMEWDVGRSIKAVNFYQAANELLQYDVSKGVRLADLARRRARERQLFLTPVKPSKPVNPLDVLYPNERRVINSYLHYIKHLKLHPHGIKVSKEAMVNFRGDIYDAATYGRLKNGQKVKKGWNINNRKARYELMRKYTI